MQKGGKPKVSLFQLLGSLIGLGGAQAAGNKTPNRLSFQTKTIDNTQPQQGGNFKSLADQINFGGGFR